MKILTYGEIMERGTSRFTVVAQLEGEALSVRMTGAIRVDNPYKHLSDFLAELRQNLAGLTIRSADFDFTDLKYCNSIGFYVLMDIIECVYTAFDGPVNVRRLAEDDWQQQSLPILLNLDDEAVRRRTTDVDFPDL